MDNKKHKIRRFLGMWIPAEIWERKSISIPDKTFLAEINSLNLDGDGCFRSNKSFGEFFNITPNSCGRIIDRLVKKGLVIREIDDSKSNNNRRRLWVIEGLLEPKKASPLRVTPPPLASPQRVRLPHPNGGGGLTPTGEALYIEENTVEKTKRKQLPAPPVSLSLDELLEKIPKGAQGYRLGIAIQGQSFLEYCFIRWYIVDAIGLFTKNIDLTEIQLTEWDKQFKRFTEPVMTAAITAIYRDGVTKSNMPGLSTVIKQAIIAQGQLRKPIESKPTATKSTGGEIQALSKMTKEELQKHLEKHKDNPAESSRTRHWLGEIEAAESRAQSKKKVLAKRKRAETKRKKADAKAAIL